MKKNVSLLIMLVLLLSSSVDTGILIVQNDNCHITTIKKTVNLDGGIQCPISLPGAKSGSTKHENSPIDCHACLGHCHSLHPIGMLHLFEIKICNIIIVTKLVINQYRDDYMSVHLNNIFRPPIC